MKKVLFLLLFACVGLGLQAQDPVKDIKKAKKMVSLLQDVKMEVFYETGKKGN